MTRLLQEPDLASYRQTLFGPLREPDSIFYSDCRQTSFGLLCEPDSIFYFDCRKTSSELLQVPDFASDSSYRLQPNFGR